MNSLDITDIRQYLKRWLIDSGIISFMACRNKDDCWYFELILRACIKSLIIILNNAQETQTIQPVITQ